MNSKMPRLNKREYSMYVCSELVIGVFTIVKIVDLLVYG